ncbi:MAG: hypothetical protein ACK4SQ_14505 [Allorhizobium sp.]
MSSKYRAEQTVSISAFESGEEIEILMVVNFKVHPGCKQTMTDPAEEPTAEVDQVQFFNISNGKPLPHPLSMPVWLLNSLTDGEAFTDWLLSEAADQNEMALDYAAEAYRDVMMEAKP